MRFLLWILTFCMAGLAIADESTPEGLAAARKDGDTFAQIELIRRSMDGGPGDQARISELAELWLEAGDDEMAAKTLESLPDAPQDLAARIKARKLLTRDKDLARAIAALQSVKEPSPATLNELQGLLARQGDWPGQASVLTRMLAMEKSAPLLMTRADAFRQAGEFQKAIQDARAAAAFAPEDSSVRNGLPSFERLERAMTSISKASATLKKSPSNLGALLRRSAAYAAAELPNQAAADAKAALSIMPDSLAAAILLAYNSSDEPVLPIFSYLPKPPDDAMAALTKWDEQVAVNSDEARVNRLVFLNQRIGQPTLAWREASDVLSREPDDSRAAMEGLLAATLLNERRKTGAAWAKLMSLQPSSAQKASAMEAMAAMFFRLSDFSNSAKFAALSDQTSPSDSAKRILADAEARLAR
jgi:tetratricopeptide (TPR) repeat protein